MVSKIYGFEFLIFHVHISFKNLYFSNSIFHFFSYVTWRVWKTSYISVNWNFFTSCLTNSCFAFRRNLRIFHFFIFFISLCFHFFMSSFLRMFLLLMHLLTSSLLLLLLLHVLRIWESFFSLSGNFLPYTPSWFY